MQKIQRLRLTIVVVAFCSMLLDSSVVSAGGFAVLEQSTRGLGQSFAGATTGFGDGSSIWYNPAAMTEIEGTSFHLGNNLILPGADFENEGSSLAAALGGGPVAG
ncbi:MAG: outer membrane protein transport protein, partial [Bdellovibrionales bacterium]|nr:outer membrane protein transport protein [Bdellovibrionales bacterium]